MKSLEWEGRSGSLPVYEGEKISRRIGICQLRLRGVEK